MAGIYNEDGSISLDNPQGMNGGAVDRNSGIMGDSWTDLKVGAAGLVQGAAALGDMFARPFREEGDETFSESLANASEYTPGSKAWEARKYREYSPERLEAEQAYQREVDSHDSEIGKFGGAVYGLTSNWRAGVGRVMQSAPGMAAAIATGGATAAGLRAAGAASKLVGAGAKIASAASEGAQSGLNNAYDTINYNVENGRPRYQGVSNSALTAAGVGAVAYGMNRFGGGVEAGLLSKEARQGAGRGWRGRLKSTAGEGAEEMLQAPFETIPQNLGQDKPWYEGLGQNEAESGIAGAAMGGLLHRSPPPISTTQPQKLVGNPEQQVQPEARRQEEERQQALQLGWNGIRNQPRGPETQGEGVINMRYDDPNRTHGRMQGQADQNDWARAQMGYNPNVNFQQNVPPISQVEWDAMTPEQKAAVIYEMPTWPISRARQVMALDGGPTVAQVAAANRQRIADSHKRPLSLGWNGAPRTQPEGAATAGDSAIRMGYDGPAREGLNRPAPQGAFDERGRMMWSQDQMDDYYRVRNRVSPEAANRDRMVQEAVQKTPMMGAQPAQDVAARPRQLTKEEIRLQEKARKEAVARRDADAKKAQAKADKEKSYRDAEAARDTYHQHYANTLSVDKRPSKGEIEEDAQWHAAHPEMASTLQLLAKANKLASSRLSPSALRDMARRHHSANPISLAESLERAAGEADTIEKSDALAAAAEILRNPKADMSDFIAKRQEARVKKAAEEESQKKLDAEAKKVQKEQKAEKPAKPAKKEAEKPIEEVVPSGDAWEAMAPEERERYVKAASRSRNADFRDGVLHLDETFKNYKRTQGVLGGAVEAPKTQPEAKKEEAPKEEPKEAPKEEPKKEEKPAEKKEEPKSEPKKEEPKPAPVEAKPKSTDLETMNVDDWMALSEADRQAKRKEANETKDLAKRHMLTTLVKRLDRLMGTKATQVSHRSDWDKMSAEEKSKERAKAALSKASEQMKKNQKGFGSKLGEEKALTGPRLTQAQFSKQTKDLRSGLMRVTLPDDAGKVHHGILRSNAADAKAITEEKAKNLAHRATEYLLNGNSRNAKGGLSWLLVNSATFKERAARVTDPTWYPILAQLEALAQRVDPAYTLNLDALRSRYEENQGRLKDAKDASKDAQRREQRLSSTNRVVLQSRVDNAQAELKRAQAEEAKEGLSATERAKAEAKTAAVQAKVDETVEALEEHKKDAAEDAKEEAAAHLGLKSSRLANETVGGAEDLFNEGLSEGYGTSEVRGMRGSSKASDALKEAYKLVKQALNGLPPEKKTTENLVEFVKMFEEPFVAPGGLVYRVIHSNNRSDERSNALAAMYAEYLQVLYDTVPPESVSKVMEASPITKAYAKFISRMTESGIAADEYEAQDEAAAKARAEQKAKEREEGRARAEKEGRRYIEKDEDFGNVRVVRSDADETTNDELSNEEYYNYGRRFNNDGTGYDAFVGPQDVDKTVPQLRRDKHPNFLGTSDEAVGATSIFVRWSLGGNGGWCQTEDMGWHIDQLRKRPRSKSAQKIFDTCLHLNAKGVEGIAVPVTSELLASPDVRADLATIVTPECAEAIARAVKNFKANKSDIPMGAYFVDLGMQNEMHISPYAVEITGGQFHFNRIGFRGSVVAKTTPLNGKGSTEADADAHVIAIGATKRNPCVGAAKRRASDVQRDLIGTHESLHEQDERGKGEAGRALLSGLPNAGDSMLLRAVSLLGVSSEIKSARAAAEFLHKADKTFDAVADEAAKLWSKMSMEERASLAHTFSYPWVRAKEVRAQYAAKHPNASKTELDRAESATLAAELYAAWGSAYMDIDGPGRGTLLKYFPESAMLIDCIVGYGSDLARDYKPKKKKGVKDYGNSTVGSSYSAVKGEDEGAGRSMRDDVRSVRGSSSENASRDAEPERGRDSDDESASAQSTRKETAEERQARKLREEQEAFEARVQKAIKDSVLPDPEMSRADGIDPAVYETEEGKKVVREYAEAICRQRSAESRVANAVQHHGRGSKEWIKARNDEGMTNGDLVMKRNAFTEYQNRMRKEPQYTPPKPQSEEQYPYDRWVNKIKNPTLRGMARNVAASFYKHGLGFTFTRDLVNIVKSHLPAAVVWQKHMDAADQERRKWEARGAAIGQKYDALTQQERDQLDEYLESSVIDGIWYALPDNAPKEVKDLYDAMWSSHMDEEGNSLGSTKWQDAKLDPSDMSPAVEELYKDVLGYSIAVRQEAREGTLANIKATYDKLIESNPSRKAEYETDRDAEMAIAEQSLKDTTMPYVPLRRFGNYVVILRSPEYEKKWQRFEALQNAAKAIANPNAATKRAVRDARAEVIAMQSNGSDYIVQFVETANDAVELRSQLQGEHPECQVVYKERREFLKKDQLDLQKLLNIAKTAAADAAPGKGDVEQRNEHAARVFSDFAVQMYIQNLSNDSALKSRLHRRKVAGYSKDMMRSFMSTVPNDARYLGFLKYSPQIRDSVDEMIKQADTSTDQAAATTALNEILSRIEQSVEGTSPATNAALRTTSAWMLLTNPAFFMQNLTQPLLYSVPYIAPRYGMYRALNSISHEMIEVAGWLRQDGTLSFLSDIDTSKASEAKERLKELEARGIKLDLEDVRALQDLQKAGLLDVGLSQEFGEYNQAEHGVVANKVLGWTNFLSKAARQVEIVNRASTGLVVYRMEKQRLIKRGVPKAQADLEARRYADHVLYETHGDYSSRNAPRYFKMNAFTRLASQFRKFQLIQLGLMFRMIKQAMDSTPSEERAYARAGLIYTMAAFALVTGVRGMPVIGTAMLALGLAGGPGDDDEDVVRKALYDAGVSRPVVDFMVRGLPAAVGLDLSEKLGARNMLLPTPYYDGSYLMKNGEDDALGLIASIAGPMASLFVKGGRAGEYLWQGDTYKGLETAAPTGIGNIMKAIRFGMEGISTKGGDVLVPGEQFTLADLITQGIGLPSTEITNRSLRASSMYRHQEAYQGLAKGIRRDYQKAVRNQDAKGMEKARNRWVEMNNARVEQGFAVNKLSNLAGAVKAQLKREASAVGGVATDKSNREFAVNLRKWY